jgi:hypothetical protein
MIRQNFHQSQNPTLQQEIMTKQVVFREQCAICLEPEEKNPAMLLPCYHSFCVDCITCWLQRSPKCPLCKSTATHIIYDVKSEKNYRMVKLTDSIENNDSNWEVPVHENRSKVYDMNLEIVVDRKIHVHKFTTERFLKNKKLARRMKDFIRRELETILRTFQVELIVEHIMSLLSHVDIMSLEFCQNVKMFLKDKAERFCREVYMFGCSNLSIEAYDEQVKYTENKEDCEIQKKRSHEEENNKELIKKQKVEKEIVFEFV